MNQFWRHVVDMDRVLLECTANLDTARTYTSSVVIWWRGENRTYALVPVVYTMKDVGGWTAEELVDKLATVALL